MSSLKPCDIFDSVSKAEIDFLSHLASLLPYQGKVINIGAGFGRTGLAFMRSPNNLTVYTVDSEDRKSPFGSLYNERERFKQEGFFDEMGIRWFQIHGDSIEVGVEWMHDIEHCPMVDMVFLDGCYVRDELMENMSVWEQVLKTDGIWAIHDFEVLENSPEGMSHRKPYLDIDRTVRKIVGTSERIVIGQVETLIALRPN